MRLALLITVVSACADLKPGKTSEPAGRLSAEEREAWLLQAPEGTRQAPVPPFKGSFDTNTPRCLKRKSRRWPMMCWRKARTQRPNADRMGQSGNIKEIAHPIHGEILPLSQLRRNLWPVG